MWSTPRGTWHGLVLLALLAAGHRVCYALGEDQGQNASVAAIAGALANAIITATIKADAPAIAAARPVVHCHTLAPPQDVIGPALAKIARQRTQRAHGGAQIESTQYEIKVVAHVLSSGVIFRAAQHKPCGNCTSSAKRCLNALALNAGILRAHGNIPDAWIAAQVAQLNAAYSKVGFTFALIKVIDNRFDTASARQPTCHLIVATACTDDQDQERYLVWRDCGISAR